MMSHRYLLATVAVCLAVGPAAANPGKYLLKPAPWFAGDEARQVAANILSFQSELTFNDNAMVRLLGFVREVAIGNGYAWYGTWPQKLLEVEYPAWKRRLATTAER